MTFSTGIACCTIYRGEIIRGVGFSGEIGQARFTEKGDRLEQEASGSAIRRLAESMETDVDSLIQKYLQGDDNPVERLVDQWSRVIYAIICLLDPQRLVLGGGVIRHHPGLLEKVKERLQLYILTEQKVALERLVLGSPDGLSGCVGAGMLMWERLDKHEIVERREFGETGKGDRVGSG
ncbi:ROK family protein [Melghirimyces profundicolus]|uniref:ROK family protein n=1 Tax=Melghirimyces profundicolus TaxID=1242148 RepID=A0A2T6BR08_9BACL|nr:ROK family protein [Melghirimyces profundicolus]PTX58489.1 ROK family protein [Melghirimyces profundicolus]